MSLKECFSVYDFAHRASKNETEFMCEEKAAKLFAPKQKGGETTHKLRLLLDFNKKQQWNRKNKVAFFLHSSRKKKELCSERNIILYTAIRALKKLYSA